ncbi:MAG: hypothetical protein KC657_40070 [Myxococcales bacterium]|nr:hypothetical protein [Myxococcales bacterium]
MSTKQRERTLSLRMNDEEILQAHALADLTDDSVGRYVRRLLAREYARLFGDEPPPVVPTRMGRPRRKA